VGRPHLENAGENRTQNLTWIAVRFDTGGDFIIGKENGIELALKEDTAMNRNTQRRFRAGDSLQDLCRACKTVRGHTVIVADSEGGILRVICDYCGSQHNYRGGENKESAEKQGSERQDRGAAPLVSDRERRMPVANLTTSDGSPVDLELLLRRIIREETGLTPVPMADKWRGGEMILRPGKPGLQEKNWPIETFFHKVVMLRNRLRVLEQQINGTEMAEDLKVRLQAYVTGCYGTLTSFNILFAEEEDRFQGNSDKD
jgi:RNase P subunit RPR2